MSKAAAKPAAKGGAVVKWDEALAARAKLGQKAVENIGGGGEFISFKGGQITYKNQAVGSKLEVVIPSFVLENAFYEDDYDPNNPASPVCYAFGQDEESMAPHEKAEKPQADSCADCPMNEWDSGRGGKGKACKNQIRFAALPADVVDEGADAVAEEKEAYAKVPPTSLKAWGAYVNSLASSGKPPLAFVTEITVTPDPQSQFKVSFKAKEQIPDELIGPMLDRADKLDEAIGFPYAANQDKPATPVRGASRGKAAPVAQARPSAKRAGTMAVKPVAATPGRRKF